MYYDFQKPVKLLSAIYKDYITNDYTRLTGTLYIAGSNDTKNWTMLTNAYSVRSNGGTYTLTPTSDKNSYI